MATTRDERVRARRTQHIVNDQGLAPPPFPVPPRYPQSRPHYSHDFDRTGQVAPEGMRPRVATTLWEDEGCLCFQVNAKGVCVARREDNNFINGTKLLNVAGVNRGFRDGLLKGERTKHVVKAGPMHLKGAWIPFERALDLANMHKITAQLYPLFVHDISAFISHPANQRGSIGTNNAMAAPDRRELEEEQRYTSTPAASQVSSIRFDLAQTRPSHTRHTSRPTNLDNSSNSYEWDRTVVSELQEKGSLSIAPGFEHRKPQEADEVNNKLPKKGISRQRRGQKFKNEEASHIGFNPSKISGKSPSRGFPDQASNCKLSGYPATAQTVAVDETSISDTARAEIVNRLMDTFYEIFGETMEDSSDSESEDSSSEEVSSIYYEAAEARAANNNDRVQKASYHGAPLPPDLPYGPSGRTAQGVEGISDGPQDGTGRNPIQGGQLGVGTSDRTSLDPARTGRGKKRKSMSDAGGSDDEGCEDRRKQPRRASAKNSGLLSCLRRFACPFVKRHPNQPPKCAACVYPGFGTVHRVKEHLYRNHIRPNSTRCARCYESFDDESLLRAHVIAAERCPQGQAPPEDDRLSPEQERNLRRKRRSGRENSEGARWRQIFRICFPEVAEADIPSPYCDRQHSQYSKEFEHFEQFQRRRLPELVRQALDEAVRTAPQLAQLEDSVRSQLVGIIRTCQDRVCEQYRAETDQPRDQTDTRHPHPDTITQSLSSVPEVRQNETSAREHRTNAGSNDGFFSNPAPAALLSVPQDVHCNMNLNPDIYTFEHTRSRTQGADSGYGSGITAFNQPEGLFWPANNIYTMAQQENPADQQSCFPFLPADFGEGSSGVDDLRRGLRNDPYPGVFGQLPDPFTVNEVDGDHSRMAPFPNYSED